MISLNMESPLASPASISLDSCKRILEGYKPLEFPDLSAERVPLHNSHTAVCSIPHPNRPENEIFESLGLASIDSAILTTLGRILGTYCGASDVLLGIATDTEDVLDLIRVSWDESRTWKDVIITVAQSLNRTGEYHVTSSVLRRALELTEKQAPCLALCRFVSNRAVVAGSDYPLIFTFDNSNRSLSLTATTTKVHPSISSLLLSQITALFDHALSHPMSPISLSPQLPPNLLSVYERASPQACISIYSHMPPPRIITDFIARRARSSPQSIALCWYPELTNDSNGSAFKSEMTTYAELHSRSNRLARWLLAKGLAREDRVAMCMSRNAMFHAAVIGIMRAGGCYVPVRLIKCGIEYSDAELSVLD